MIINDDYRVIYEDMPTTVKAFIKETDGFYNIVLNPRLTHEANIKSFADEMDHIVNKAFDSKLSADQIESKSHRRNL